MPFPFFAHQAPVLPLKLAMPRRWSGTGLVLGSMAPDFGAFLIANGTPSAMWHRPSGVLLLCLPTALVAYWLVTRLVAEPVARQVPMLGGFRLKAVGYVAAQPTSLAHWLTVAASIAVGAGTHVGWDLFTQRGSRLARRLPFLDRPLLTIAEQDIVGSDVLWALSTMLGALVTTAALWHIGRHDLLRRWAEAREAGSTARVAPYAPPATRSFWTLILGAAVVAFAATYVTRPLGFYWHDKATWVLVFLRGSAIVFLVGCIAIARERRAFASTTRHQ